MAVVTKVKLFFPCFYQDVVLSMAVIRKREIGDQLATEHWRQDIR